MNDVLRLPNPAVHQDNLADDPAYRLDLLLGYRSMIVEKCEVRGEFLSSGVIVRRESSGKPMVQLVEGSIFDAFSEHNRMSGPLAREAHNAIERDGERSLENLAKDGCSETKRTLPYGHRNAEAVKRNVKVRSKEWPSG